MKEQKRQARENRGRSIPRTELKEDKEFIETVLIPLWESWTDELIADGDSGKLPSKIFSEYSGATEKSPTALMFTAFCGGVDKGVELIKLMEEDKKRGAGDHENNSGN